MSSIKSKTIDVKRLFKKHKVVLLYFVLFFLSRVFFINASGVFFDSAEYLHLFSLSNFPLAIVLGHFPPHEGYIILFWPFYQLMRLFHANAPYVIVLLQIFLSFFTLLCFYRFIEYISDKKTALYASIIASLIPLFWIINVTIMMENAYAFFFFFSIFVLIQYIKTKKQYLLHVSLLIFSFALLTQTMIILWTPVYLYIIFLKNKKELFKITILMIVYAVILSICNIFFIGWQLSMKPQTVFLYLYLKKGGEFAEIPFGVKGILIVLRNFVIPLLQNNTTLVVLLAFISLIFSIKKNKKIFLFGILFLLPAIYANQWWDSLLNGRHALIASFGMAFLVSWLIVKRNIIYFLLIICYLLLVSLPALNLLDKPIPYLEEAHLASTLPKKSLFIESHFARPQVQETVKNETVYVNEPGWDTPLLTKRINTYLAKNELVFISSAAISEPYGLYSGPYLHNITLSYEFPFLLKPILTSYTIKPYKTINAKDNLFIYRIVSAKPSPYPQVKNLKDSYRRLDYTDPFWQATWWLENTFLHK